MKTNRRREYLRWCSMGVIMPAVILAMCFRYTDVMTSVGLIAERVFPIILGLLLLLCFMLVGLYMLNTEIHIEGVEDDE